MLLDQEKRESGRSAAFCAALCGITASFVLTLMFISTMFPMFSYAIPTYAGFLMVVVITEAGTKWAVTTYFSCAVLCMLVTPNYEANILFIIFMGYYPILNIRLQNIKPGVFRFLVKEAVFNLAVIIYALIFQYVFTTVDLLEGMESLGKFAVPALVIMANVFFVLYDNLLNALTEKYMNWFRKKILRKR